MCGIQQGYAELETHAWQTRACKSSNLTTGRYDIYISEIPYYPTFNSYKTREAIQGSP